MSSFPHEIQGLNNVFSKFFLEEQRQESFLGICFECTQELIKETKAGYIPGGGGGETGQNKKR